MSISILKGELIFKNASGHIKTLNINNPMNLTDLIEELQEIRSEQLTEQEKAVLDFVESENQEGCSPDSEAIHKYTGACAGVISMMVDKGYLVETDIFGDTRFIQYDVAH